MDGFPPSRSLGTPGRDAPRLTLAVRVIWAVLFAVTILRGLLVHHQKHQGLYEVYRRAGVHWVEGTRVYNERDSLTVFRYAPLVAASLAPLAELPDVAGALLFRAANVVIFALGAMAFGRYIVEAQPGSRKLAWYWLTLAPLSASALLDTQVNALATGFLLLAVGALPRSRWNLAAICLSAAILLKVYPLSLALLCTLLYPRALSWRLALCLLVGLALPFAMQRPSYVQEEYLRWFHLMAVNDRQVLSLSDWYRDIRLPLELLGIHIGSRAYTEIELIMAGVFALAVLRLRRSRLSETHRLGITYTLGAVWMTAFGAATEGVTYIILAPTVAWLAAEALSRSYSLGWRIGVSAVSWFFVFIEAAPIFPFGKAFRALGPQPVAALVVMALAMTVPVALSANRPVPDAEPGQ